ncbi:TRAM domain protein [uncultured archaeon]|nr:TRAM domain protein [uncultured archaeon]
MYGDRDNRDDDFGGGRGGRGGRGGSYGGRGGGGGFGRGGGGGGFMPKPVKEGDEIELTIEAVGAKGDGIGKIEGFVVFVPNCTAGEKIKCRIVQVRGRSAIGEKVE